MCWPKVGGPLQYVADWPPMALAESASKDVPPVYRALMAVLAAAVRQDLELSQAAVDACAAKTREPEETEG